MAVFGFRPEQGDIMSSNRTPLIQISATIARFSFRSSAFMLLALLVASLAPPLRGQTLTILYAFPGQPDGSGPYAPPIKDKHGNLYGTTYAGGSKDWGTVYEISASGKETVLHSFVGGKDGSTPTSGLIMDARGNLYGTTYTGGSTACFNGYGCGVVYKLSPRQGGGWKETILYAFKGRSDGGLLSFGDLTRDAEGNLYGTTMYGGSRPWPHGGGVVFKLTHTSGRWLHQTLYAFGTTSKKDGATPYGGVILDAQGNVYGTTFYGGSAGAGTVFELDVDGSETFLFSFGISSDGLYPEAGLVRDEAGNLYGTTMSGGDPSCACGTAFKLNPSGAETVLHVFAGYPSDGASPRQLTLDPAGNLYGTTYYGGSSTDCGSDNQPIGCGTIFKLSPSGDETVLHNFSHARDGSEVWAGVTLRGRYLYGGTSAGGPDGNGIVYKLTK
jgi:uncharacterized repeat protein (TIGR03803 family)